MLGAAQLFIGGAPLLITLYAAGVMPPERYASVAALEAMTAFTTVAVLYSFEITGSAAISRFQLGLHPREIGVTIGEVLSARIAIWVVTSCVLIGAVFIGGGDTLGAAAWPLVSLTSATQMGWVCVPIGLPGPFALTTVVTRTVSIALAFALIDNTSQPSVVPLLIGIPALVGNLAVLAYMRSRYGVPLRLVHDVPVIAGKIRRDADFFFGNVGITLFRDANPAVLTLLGLPAEAITHYSIMEKIVKALQNIVRPINQHFYRRIARYIFRLRRQPIALYWGLLRKSSFQAALYVLASSAALVALITLEGLTQIPQIANIVRVATEDLLSLSILLVAPIVGVFNYWLGVVGLAIRGERRAFVLVAVATGLVGISVTSILSAEFSYVGACIGFTTGEVVFFTLSSSTYLSKRTRTLA